MRHQRKRIYFTLGLIGFIFINIGTKMFFFDFFHIKGNSMYPTIKDNTYVCIMKSAYGIRLPRNVYEIPWFGTLLYYIVPNAFIEKSFKQNKRQSYLNGYSRVTRGDIIAFSTPTYKRSLSIKRCVAIPGDSIIEHTKNCLSPLITPFKRVPRKGEKVSAKELGERAFMNLQTNNSFHFIESDSTFLVLEDCYFVLGDNIEHSDDSRLWGLVPQSSIVGKYLFSINP